MMNNDDFDFDVIDPEAVDYRPQLPFSQWVNGDRKLAKLGGIAATGGLLFPNENIPDGFVLPNAFTPTEFTFDNGKTISGRAASTVELAVIRYRFRWMQLLRKTSQGKKIYAYTARSGYDPDAVPKMRGNIHAIVLLRGSNQPVVLALTGRNSQIFEETYLGTKSRVLPVVNKAAKEGKALACTVFGSRFQRRRKKRRAVTTTRASRRPACNCRPREPVTRKS